MILHWRWSGPIHAILPAKVPVDKEVVLEAWRATGESVENWELRVRELHRDFKFPFITNVQFLNVL